jgi:hypothetical protein
MPGVRCVRFGLGHFLQCAALLAAAALAGGCSPAPPSYDTSSDVGAINNVLAELGDASTSNSVAERIFAKGSIPKPAERAKFRNYNIFAAETTVDGTEAKIKAELRDGNGEVVGTQDWTATKADGTWRLQSTPMP